MSNDNLLAGNISREYGFLTNTKSTFRWWSKHLLLQAHCWSGMDSTERNSSMLVRHDSAIGEVETFEKSESVGYQGPGLFDLPAEIRVQ